MNGKASQLHFVNEEDLEVVDGKLCLILRFKNCTGNIVSLSDSTRPTDMAGLTKAQVAISIDPTFLKSRSRTVRQALEMVLRWRAIG